MIDRTRSSIEEDFSLEEQNFQSVIDMETEDDYSRGNAILYSNVLLNNQGTTTNTLVSAGNYFIEALAINLAYGQVSFGPGTAQLSATLSIVGSVSLITFFTFTYQSLPFFVGGGTIVQNILINQPFYIDMEALISRGDGINCVVTVNATGSSVTAAFLVYTVNIYGRIVP